MTIHRLHIALLDLSPPIWRQVEIASRSTLAELHWVLQAAMGWQGSHLHDFEIGEQRYGVPDPEFMEDDLQDETSMSVAEALPDKRASLFYRYDFGDGWTHAILAEEIVAADPGAVYPRVLGGARACPPEDSGGSFGYADLLAILGKPRHKEHRSMREWVGLSFDPERFSLEEANRRLHRRRRKGRAS